MTQRKGIGGSLTLQLQAMFLVLYCRTNHTHDTAKRYRNRRLNNKCGIPIYSKIGGGKLFLNYLTRQVKQNFLFVVLGYFL
jgi:hypothetical protein